MEGLTTTWAEQDLERREREEAAWLRSRPVCDMCGEPILDDIYFAPEPDACYCDDCFALYVRDNFIRDIPDIE